MGASATTKKIITISYFALYLNQKKTMQRSTKTIQRSIPPLVAILLFFIFFSATALPVERSFPDSLSAERVKLLNGEVLVVISDLEDGVTGVEGHIYIAAPPKKVWEVLTDYNNHKNFVPNIIDSGLISDNGVEKVMFEKGKSGIFIFQKTVNIKMRVWGELPKQLNFEQITGDFQVYHGEWILAEYPQGPGTFLTYRASVKPDFVAPRFAVKNVQQHDCPKMMSAMKKQAELTLLPAL